MWLYICYAMAALGYCQCGCGQRTALAANTRPEWGEVKGQPQRFVHNHHRRIPVEQRFWTKVEKRGADDCWLWRASRNQKGYGQITLSTYAAATRRPYLAHRIAWELTFGPIPAGLEILHRCDNPSCVNPAHLSVGTRADNMQDAAKKGRTRQTFSRKHHPNRRLIAEQVLEARSLVTAREATVASLARGYGVSYSALYHAVVGRTWKYL